MLYRLRGRLMPIRRTSRTLKAGSVIGGFRIYSKRQGGLQHCSRLVSVPTTRKPCYLSQTAGLHRFLILYKDYNTAAFFTGSGFSGAKIRRKTEKIRENQRKTEKIGEFKRKSEKIREIQRKSENLRENQRKSEKNG